MLRKNPWLASYRPRAVTAIRLFCFSYAGGSANAFRNWPNLLPDTVEICPVELPGRGHRFSEPLAIRLDELLETMLAALRPMMDQPYALFGHSLGAVLAFETARRQAVAGLRLPRRLFISGQRAPDRPDPKPPLHLLSEEDFLAELRRLGGTPPEVFDDPELVQLFLPLLRADFVLGETFAYPPAQPLPCPLSAYGGTRDPEINEHDVRSWESWTTADFRVRFFDGDHFFLHSCERELTSSIAADLQAFV